jgi:hypothetical protein
MRVAFHLVIRLDRFELLLLSRHVQTDVGARFVYALVKKDTNGHQIRHHNNHQQRPRV